MSPVQQKWFKHVTNLLIEKIFLIRCYDLINVIAYRIHSRFNSIDAFGYNNLQLAGNLPHNKFIPILTITIFYHTL